MKLPFRTRIGTAAAIGCIAAVVVALAVIQYRWNQEASDATGVRLADSLQLSMINWHLDLFRNLSEVCLTMRTPADHGAQIDQWVDRLAEWRSLARYPELVANVYLLRRRAPDRVDLVPVVPGAPVLERERWPRAVEQIVSHLDRATAESSKGTVPSGRQLTESFYNIGSALRVWRFDPIAPALVRTTRTTVTDGEWLLVELNEEVLRHHILPDLAARYFQGIDGLDYEVAVVSGGRPRRVVYASDPGFADREVSDADDAWTSSAAPPATPPRRSASSIARPPIAARRRRSASAGFHCLATRPRRKTGNSWCDIGVAVRSDRSWPGCASADSPSASPRCSCWC